MGTDGDPTLASEHRAAMDEELLVAAASALGVELGAEEVALFGRYAEEIAAWNRRFNLTRIDTPEGIAVQHFADSLACLGGVQASSRSLRVVEVGSGAGMPGLPLKIVRPDWRLTLVESVGKKAGFLANVVRVLRLENVSVEARRAEDVGRDAAHRESYDLALARAVARLSVLAEYMLPLVVVGGRMLALKGSDIDEEVARAGHAVTALGGSLVEVREYSLPGIDGERALVIIDKVAATAEGYPRRAGVPAKRPLSG